MICALIIAVVLGTMVCAMLYGKAQARMRQRSLEEWALGGRKMGTLVFWFLNAGEIYTTFAVLGISGFAWAYGAPAYLAFCSVSLSAAVGYWLTPRIHAYGRTHGLVTHADFFAHRYGSQMLGVVVALAGLLALVVYVQIQVTALAMVMQLAIGPAVSKGVASLLAVMVMLALVFLAGLRSAAFAAGVKDVLMLVIVVLLAGSVAGLVGAHSLFDVFSRVQDLYPEAVRFPGRQPALGLDMTWLATSAINVAVGTYVFPHMFQLCYSAGGEDTIRRNAVFQPLYSLSYFFIILLGFAALLAATHPAGDDPNALLLTFIAQRCPAWLVGLFAGTAALLALVPGSVLLLTCGSIFARNVMRPLIPGLEGTRELAVSRLSMLGFAALALALWLALEATRSLVEVGLSAYAATGMLAPGVYLAFMTRRVPTAAVVAGLAAGFAVLWIPIVSETARAVFIHWDLGLVALLANFTVVLGVAAPMAARKINPAGAVA